MFSSNVIEFLRKEMEKLWGCLHLINYEANYLLEYYVVYKFFATIASEMLIEIGLVAERSYLSSFSLLKNQIILTQPLFKDFNVHPKGSFDAVCQEH